MAAVAAGQTVLTPNTELAASLFDAVERAHQESGLEVWPTPRVRDFGSWLREQYAAGQLRDAATPRALSDIEERELWREVVDSSDLGRELLDAGGAARAARRARRTLHEYGIPLRAVEEYAAATEESQVFLGWNREFERRCRRLDCIGSDLLLAAAPLATESIVWIDTPAWRPAARRWLQRHGRPLSPLNLEPRAAVSTLSAPSDAAELASMGEWALANLRADERFRAWICLPDLGRRRAEAADALDAALAPQRFGLGDQAGIAPYALAGGTPLAEFAPVRAALELLDAAVDTVSFERFSSLLRAPELQGGLGEEASSALLDVQLRRLGPSEADASAWLTLGARIAADRGLGGVASLERLQAAFGALDEMRGSQPASVWVRVWIRAFEAAPWSLRHRWSSLEYQAAERFRELLASLAAADAFFGTLSRRAAQRILRRAALDTPFQVQTGVPPIWVSGQLADPWLNYPGLWVSGCTDQRWPPPVEPVPLLPIGLQREFGVIAASAESQLEFALDLQNRWAVRARECVFSHAAESGRVAAASPLLPGAATTVAPALPRPHWHALMRQGPTLERITDEWAPPFTGGERNRGIAALRAQSRCAFRGFAESRLDCERLELPVPGFNERERGELVHAALEHIWSQLRDSHALLTISADARTQLLDVAIASALRTVCRRRDPGRRWRSREHDRLAGLLARWLETEKLRQPFSVEELEVPIPAARFAGLEFGARIDRVDRLADGSRVLIDYKTGNAGTDWRGERPDNPQLPVYALLRPEALVAVAYGVVNAAECGFVAETQRPELFKPRGKATSLEDMQSMAALIEVWSERIEGLAADFAGGRAVVAPTERACQSCRLQALCRVPAALDDETELHD
jgi:probable DNA repair protein